ncbi:hypothetical protein R3X27_02880 [Tropicimonas sp. TH_r6]|uniref:hypothetical protein n=1 Tax=Tropicimonas sp. TH_r6 TaxID=3082085 RepID=UPI002954A873|nr:hypothetical protein [Tropicimonas sp. TH_r6]MDV7141619.1 hypothetical protein [Tropicimonas sp. TH_r6]
MKTTLMVALLAGLAIPAGTAAFARGDTPSKPDSSPKGTINISCYRGIARTVAWDRPNAVFVEDLIKYGYGFKEAHIIGERVCRDEWGVGDHGHMKETLLRLLRESPPTGR